MERLDKELFLTSFKLIFPIVMCIAVCNNVQHVISYIHSIVILLYNVQQLEKSEIFQNPPIKNSDNQIKHGPKAGIFD